MLLAISTLFAQSEWNHIYRKSGDLQITLDYKYSATRTDRLGNTGAVPAYDRYAMDLWVNVTLPQINAGDKVSVVIVNYEYARGYRGQYSNTYYNTQKVYTLNLSYDRDNHFTGKLDKVLIDSSSNDGYGVGHTFYAQEIAVAINGRWYKDPSTSNNIKFNLFQNK